ncbi:MAG: AtpZ/AtpI family protein [Eubacteriales bacterium]
MDKNKLKIMQGLVLITQIGIVMVVPIAIGFFIGRFLDNLIGTNYIFLFIFIIIGVGAAFLNLFKIGLRDQDKRK